MGVGVGSSHQKYKHIVHLCALEKILCRYVGFQPHSYPVECSKIILWKKPATSGKCACLMGTDATGISFLADQLYLSRLRFLK